MSNHRHIRSVWKQLFLCCFVFGLSYLAEAAQLVQNYDGMEINWATLKVKFIGKSKLIEANENSYRLTEQKALSNGLLNISDPIRRFFQKHAFEYFTNEEMFNSRQEAVIHLINTSTYITDTSISSNKNTQLVLENSLTKILHLGHLRFQQIEPPPEPSPSSQYTGIVLQIEKRTDPMAYYKIINPAGEVTFSAKDMAKHSHERHLMGRWFVDGSKAEWSGYVGPSPLVVQVKTPAAGLFMIEKTKLDLILNGYRSLLVGGRMVINLPP